MYITLKFNKFTNLTFRILKLEKSIKRIYLNPTNWVPAVAVTPKVN